MAKKLPKGFSVKTTVVEKNMVEMYKWAIFKDGFMVKQGHELMWDRTECREDGVETLFKCVDDL